MPSTRSPECLKKLAVAEKSVDTSPSLSAKDSKQLETPSSDSINLESQIPPPPPYHVFTRPRKLQMVCIVSLAAIFSPLSSNIYFPALGAISRVSCFISGTLCIRWLIVLTNLQDLNVSMSLTILTVTVYMIVQGLAPSFWGSFSDVVGRRGIFIGTFVVYILSNILLAVSTNYGELMAFRALQAAGSSATISIGIYRRPCNPDLFTDYQRRWCNWRHHHICRERKLGGNLWWR